MANSTAYDNLIALLPDLKTYEGTIYLKSSLPEHITVIANWGVTSNEKVLVSSKSTNPNPEIANFGWLDMYPLPIKAISDLNVFNFVIINPVIKPPNNNYCYASEIYMVKKSDINGNFSLYEGVGAFTTAYNPAAQYTSEYDTSVNNQYPKLSGTNVYLHSTLKRVTPSANQWVLSIEVVATITSSSGSASFSSLATTFEHVFDNVPPTTFNNKIGEGGISGTISETDVSPPIGSPALKGVMTDVQLVTSKNESDFYASLLTSESLNRKSFVDHYEFDYENFINNYWLYLERLGA